MHFIRAGAQKQRKENKKLTQNEHSDIFAKKKNDPIFVLTAEAFFSKYFILYHKKIVLFSQIYFLQKFRLFFFAIYYPYKNK